VKEAILAVRISQFYSKDKILELYLNEIYLGMGSYGVAAAAQNYFGKGLDELTIEEAALLAADLIQPESAQLEFDPLVSPIAMLARRAVAGQECAESSCSSQDMVVPVELANQQGWKPGRLYIGTALGPAGAQMGPARSVFFGHVGQSLTSTPSVLFWRHLGHLV
jgi:hypothetical protein